MKNPLATRIGIAAFDLALNAPLMCVQQRWPDTLHAAGMEAVIDMVYGGRRTVESVCGKRALRLVGSAGTPVPWPPRLKGLPERMVRCQDCYEGTGKPRPRVNFKTAGSGEEKP